MNLSRIFDSETMFENGYGSDESSGPWYNRMFVEVWKDLEDDAVVEEESEHLEHLGNKE